jgi:CRISPR/Cas system type I-B associated protein Csh2 (Cas7 group RAMP superfamily)
MFIAEAIAMPQNNGDFSSDDNHHAMEIVIIMFKSHSGNSVYTDEINVTRKI